MAKIISKLIKGFLQRDARTHASSIAFFFFMSFIPMMILFAAVVPLFGISVDSIIRFFKELLPEGVHELAGEIIREAFDHSAFAFSLSALILLWTASRGVNALTQGLNSMYDQKEKRGFARLTALSFGYTLILLVFMCAAIFLIFSGRISDFLKRVFPQVQLHAGLIPFLEYLLLLVAGCLFFCFVYQHLPAGKRSLSWQFPGAFLASTGWVFFAMGLRVYVSVSDSFTRLYGSLATVILLLFWFYWIFFILLIGGYVNAHLAELVPAKFLSFYYEKKTLSLIVTGLFLLGFFAFLSECWLNCRLYMYPSHRFFLVIFRVVTMFSWLVAVIISLKEMKMSFPGKQMLILGALMAGNVILMRRSAFKSLFVYLIVFTIWNIAILFMCAQVMFSEEKGA